MLLIFLVPSAGTPEAAADSAITAISGADIVEVSPPFDHGTSHPPMSHGLSLTRFGSNLAEITTIAAAELARDLLYLLRGDIDLQHSTPPMPPYASGREEL